MIHYLHLDMQNKNTQYKLQIKKARVGRLYILLREYSRKIWYSSFSHIGKKSASPYPTQAT